MSRETLAPKETFEPEGFTPTAEDNDSEQALPALGNVALRNYTDWEDGLEPTWFCFSD